MDKEEPPLNLATLAAGYPGLTPSAGETFAEAAAICLDWNQHTNGIRLQSSGHCDKIWPLIWNPVTNQMRRTWSDLSEATEKGACGIAILVAKEQTGFSVIERSRKGTGCDFWIGDDDAFLFQNKARLEISGILKGDDKDVKKRANVKIKQTYQSDATKLPAYIIVVEFSRPISYFLERR